jgi:hypothetical protein
MNTKTMRENQISLSAINIFLKLETHFQMYLITYRTIGRQVPLFRRNMLPPSSGQKGVT